MKKEKLLKIVNVFLIIIFSVQAGTGMGHDFIPHKIFSNIHHIGGILLIIFALFHLYLNWGWVKANILKHQ